MGESLPLEYAVLLVERKSLNHRLFTYRLVFSTQPRKIPMCTLIPLVSIMVIGISLYLHLSHYTISHPSIY